jgi:tripartite-type tricarboxylate transporter receptor subunit TctC
MKLIVAAGLSLAVLTVPFAASTHAHAEEWPTRPVTWVVPFPPGGITDSGARTVAKVLGAKLGQQVIVDNKPGAGGIVGAEIVANGKADGYTFLYASNGVVVTYPFLYKKMSYDTKKAFIPVHGMSTSPMIITVKADAPYKTFAEFVAHAKKNPEKVNYFTVGQGSTQHLLGELIQKEAGIHLTQIPYKGSAPALTDLLSGTIDMMPDYQSIIAPHVEAGKLRALGVSSTERLAGMPDVKTLAEQGYPGAVFTAWSTIVYPAGTPQSIVDKLADAFGKTLEDPEIIKFFNDRGSNIMRGLAKEKLGEFFEAERVKTREIIERAGIQPE